MHDEELLRQVVPGDERGQPGRHGVEVLARRRPEHLPGPFPAADRPLRVEREPDVRLAQPSFEGPYLVEERRPAGLDVQQQQRPPAPGGGEVLGDDLGRDPDPVGRRPGPGRACATTAMSSSAGSGSRRAAPAPA